MFGVPGSTRTTRCGRSGPPPSWAPALAALNAELEARWGVRLRCAPGSTPARWWSATTVGGQDVTVGDAVNLAARLEQAAAPGEVLLGEATYRPGPRRGPRRGGARRLAVRGKGSRCAPGGCSGSARARPGTPGAWTPRWSAASRELPLLTRGLRARGGGAAPATCSPCSGAAGVGKSRLVAEFVALVGPTGPPCWAAAACPTATASPTGRSPRSCARRPGSAPTTRQRRPGQAGRAGRAARSTPRCSPTGWPPCSGGRRRRRQPRSCSGRSAGCWRRWRAGGRWSWSWTTSTGPSRPCSTWSSTSPTGPGTPRCCCAASPARSCSTPRPAGAAAS